MREHLGLVRPSIAIAVAALVVAGCGGGSAPRPGPAPTAPDAVTPPKAPAAERLVRHLDRRAGFALSAPAGWRVATRDRMLITAASSDGSRLVAVAPFLSPDRVDARGCLSRARSTFARVFPGATLDGVASVPGGAMGRLRFGRDERASLLCALSGRAGMLYAIAAPRSAFAAERPRLVGILRTLRFTGAGRTVDAGLRFRSFRDPNEGAFTLDVPDGWKVGGGLIRRAATEAYPRVQAVAPGGGMRVFAGLKDPRTYATPNAAGVPEGTELPYAGATLVVSHYVPGPELARSVATEHIGCAGARVLGGGVRPGISQSIADAFRAAGVSLSYDVGDVRFACTSAPGRGYVIAATLLADTGAVGTWTVDRIFGYQAQPASEAVARAALRRMIASWRTDPGWEARQQGTTAAVSRINAQANREISGLIESAGAYRNAVEDEVHRKWSDATLGQTDVRDPSDGTEYKVEAGSNFYWRQAGTGGVAGTTTDDAPGADFTPLVAF